MTPADAPRFTWCARVLAPSDPARLAPPPPPPAENPRASRSPHPSRPVPDPLSLFQAAQRGDPSVIRVLVTDCGIPVDVKDKDGVTPLMSAADYAKDAAVRELLKLGAKHDAKKSDGVMAVHRAASSALSDGPPTDTCSKNAANAVRLLVEASEGGADAGTLDAPSDAGTPFLCACARGRSHHPMPRGEGRQRGGDASKRRRRGGARVRLGTPRRAPRRPRGWRAHVASTPRGHARRFTSPRRIPRRRANRRRWFARSWTPARTRTPPTARDSRLCTPPRRSVASPWWRCC